MTAALVVFLLLYSGLLGLWALAAALAGRGAGLGLVGGLVLLELTALVQVAVFLYAGRPAREPTTHAGYLIASVLLVPLLPAVAGPARSDAASERRWSCGVIAVVCVALAVVELRLVATGPEPLPR